MNSHPQPYRPSPSESATCFAVGTKKHGNDGRMYIVTETRTGVKRWVVVVSSQGRQRQSNKPSPSPSAEAEAEHRTVFITENGGTPFMVEIFFGHTCIVKVYVVKNEDEDEAYNSVLKRTDPMFKSQFQHWRTFKAKRVLVGMDPDESKQQGVIGRFLRFKKPWWHGGNSVLLEIAHSTYVFVGETIYTFKTETEDTIVEYSSPMGNNSVPYPFAVGKNNTYLMIEHTFIPNNIRIDGMDPYDQFYNVDLQTGMKYKGTKQSNKRRREYKVSHSLRNFQILHQNPII